jgi:flagellar motor switch protein FliM
MSTKEVLSEGELDALMDSVSSGDVPLDDADTRQSCQPFDFNTREQAILAQLPVLKTIHEKHALSLIQGIQELFKVPVEVEPGDTRLVKLEEIVVALNEPTGINLVQIKPLNGISLVVLSSDMLSFFVNQYFGGAPGGATFNAARTALTPTEKRINDLLLSRFLTGLDSAWSEVASLTSESVSFESNPDFLQVGNTSELVFQFSFSIKVFDWEGAIDWVIPYSSIEPLKPRLGSPVAITPAQTGTNWEHYFRKELLSVDLDVSGLYSSKNVSIADVLNLKEGSIVPLKVPTDVVLCIEGQPYCLGEHGALNGKKSIKIKKIFEREGETS